jgi:hypothetical protein
MAMSHSVRDESAYLDTEEACACRKYNAKNGWTAQAVHNQQWAQQQNTCRRVTRASQRLTVKVNRRSTTAKILWIRQGGKELSCA